MEQSYLKKRRELDIGEVIPSLFDLHLLASLIIMFVQNLLPNVHSIRDNLFRDILGQEMGY
jgi:hypothetical protein